MANTVTAFYTFSSGSKAQSAQVNNNFDVFRGDMIPVNSDTQTASDLTHDLGHTGHRWKDGYFERIILAGDTSAGTSIGTTSTGNISFTVGNSVASIIPVGGIAQLSPNRLDIGTVSAAWGGVAFSANNTISANMGGGTYRDIVNSTLTLTTVGRPVIYTCVGNVDGAFPTTGGGSFSEINLTSTIYRFFLLRNDSAVSSCQFLMNSTSSFPVNSMQFVDVNAPAGTHNYSLQMFGTNSNTVLVVNRVGFLCYEV